MQSEKEHIAYLILGSNVGDRIHWIGYGRNTLNAVAGVITAASGLYESLAWGFTEQGPFINQAVALTTHLSPEALLEVIEKIEHEAGRQRTISWGPRTLDIDIALYDDVIRKSRRLTLPHPHLSDRRFALAPLAEIAPDAVHPVLGATISELLTRCPDLSEVAILDT